HPPLRRHAAPPRGGRRADLAWQRGPVEAASGLARATRLRSQRGRRPGPELPRELPRGADADLTPSATISRLPPPAPPRTAVTERQNILCISRYFKAEPFLIQAAKRGANVYLL